MRLTSDIAAPAFMRLPSSTIPTNSLILIINIITSFYFSQKYKKRQDFFNDFEKFNSEYQKWYGEDLIESTPCFGYLGYDTGKYFLSEICKNVICIIKKYDFTFFLYK